MLKAALSANGHSSVRHEKKGMTVRLLGIFIIGLIACAAAGAKLGKALFVRPDGQHPLKPHTIRDTIAVVGGASLFVAMWVFASLFWFAPNPN